MALVSFGRGSNDRFGETLVLTHALGHLHATNLAAAVLVIAPCAAGKNTSDNHFNPEALTFQAHGYHRIRGRQIPVGTNVAGRVKEFCCNLVKYLAFKGNALRQNYVESQ